MDIHLLLANCKIGYSSLTGWDLRGMVGIGFCARRYRISREIQASDFACRGIGEAACGCGFWGYGEGRGRRWWSNHHAQGTVIHIIRTPVASAFTFGGGPASNVLTQPRSSSTTKDH